MAYHEWGEEGFAWNDLDDAIRLLDQYMRRWGRISVMQAKEKFGCARLYCHFGIQGLYSLVKPGWCFFRWPSYLKWTTYGMQWFWRPLSRLFIRWQMFIYRRAYRLAVEKWPHLTEEILCDADYRELLHGLGHERKRVKLESKREE